MVKHLTEDTVKCFEVRNPYKRITNQINVSGITHIHVSTCICMYVCIYLYVYK